MNSDQIAGLLDNNSGSSVGYRKNPVLGILGSDPVIADICLEAILDFL